MALDQQVHPSGITLQVVLGTWASLPIKAVQSPGFDQHKKINGEEYYKYLFMYTDNILAIGVDPKDILIKLNKYFKFKPDSIHPPDDYLGAKIKQTILPNGASAWGKRSSHYVRNSVKNLEEWMVKEGRKLPKKSPTPMSSTYKPEVDVSPELTLEMANF
jgi:hypothetical protein